MLLRLLCCIFLSMAVSACFEESANASKQATPAVAPQVTTAANTTGVLQPAEWNQPTICTPEAATHWLGKTPLPKTHTLVQSYGSVCKNIYPLEGLAFKQANEAFLCHVVINHEDGDSGVSEAQAKAALSEAALKSPFLNRAGFIYREFGVIMLKKGSNFELIASNEKLQDAISEITSAEGALAFLYLRGALGDGYQNSAICNAEVERVNAGWVVRNTEVFYNCKPVLFKDYFVDRVAKTITTQSSREKTNPDGSVTALCID